MENRAIPHGSTAIPPSAVKTAATTGPPQFDTFGDSYGDNIGNRPSVNHRGEPYSSYKGKMQAEANQKQLARAQSEIDILRAHLGQANQAVLREQSELTSQREYFFHEAHRYQVAAREVTQDELSLEKAQLVQAHQSQLNQQQQTLQRTAERLQVQSLQTDEVRRQATFEIERLHNQSISQQHKVAEDQNRNQRLLISGAQQELAIQQEKGEEKVHAMELQRNESQARLILAELFLLLKIPH